jgi:hypothetical protein
VSGDYESASDNLNIHLSEHILDCLRRNSTSVPNEVWIEARKALRADFGDQNVQQRGQLMGSLLSFPLLCITNYLALRFFVKRRVPLRINGDDIVFRCRPSEYEAWAAGVVSWGLTLSKGKTLVSPTLFSLNSAFFHPTEDRVEFFPFLRSSCIFGPPETANAVAGRVKSSVVGVSKQTRNKVHRLVIQECRSAILGSQRSILRGLEVPVSRKVIKDLRLASRENYYLSMPKEAPLPALWPGKKRCIFLKGWKRVKLDSDQDEDFYRELVQSCWLPMETRICDYWGDLKLNTFAYVPPSSWKYARMAGMTKMEYENYLSDDREFPPFRKDKRNWVWVRDDEVREMRFTPAGDE